MNNLRIVTAMLLVTMPTFADDPPPKPGKVELELEFRWGGTFAGNPIKEFSNIPASYRTVPWHPDDDSTRSLTATIPSSSLNPTGFLFANYMPAIGLKFYDRLIVRTGFDFQYSQKTNVGVGNDGIIRETEIHSNTYSRLMGDSLVYYAIPRPRFKPWPIPVPEIEVRVWKRCGFLAGYWQRNVAYEIERGYDRYANMQPLDKVPFADLGIKHPYVGIRAAWAPDGDNAPFFGVVFTVGPMIMNPQFVAQAQGTQILGKTRGLMFNAAFTLGGSVKKIVK